MPSPVLEPFYTGPAVSSEVPGLFPCALNGRGYYIDLRNEATPYRRRFIDQLRQPSDNSTEVGEATVNPLGLWRRGTTDWSKGAGQTLFDGPESDRARFHTSVGVDVWDRHYIKLLKDTQRKESTASNAGLLLDAGANIYVSMGGTLKRTGDATPTSPTMTPITGTPGADITALAATGEHIYVVANADIYRGTLGAGSVASWYSTTDIDRIWYVNGRLIVANDDVISEISAAAALTTIKDHEQASFDWYSVVGAPNGIYMAGHDGLNSEIYVTTVNPDTGNLRSPVIAAPLPRGELVKALCYYAGLMLIGTDKGFRAATVAEDGTLTYGPLVEVGVVNDFAADGRFIWFSWYDGTTARLGRMDPSVFTETLVPAYASDLEANLTGITPGSFEITEVVRFEGRTYFFLPGTGWFGEMSIYRQTGYLTSGLVRYGVLDPKLLVNVDYRMKPLPAGCTVGVSVTFDDDDEAVLTATSVEGSRGPSSPQQIDHAPTEWGDFKITLTHGASGLTTPEVTRWVLKAHATPEMVQEIVVPLMVSSEVDNELGPDQGGRQFYDTRLELEYLKALVRSQQIITYQEGDVSESVVVMNMEVQPVRWNPARTAFEGIIVVQLKTIEA